MVDLGAIEEDVPFDAGAADALIAACTAAASAIDGQVGSRASYVTTAMKDFKGYFSGLFADNASTAKGDATELVARLKESRPARRSSRKRPPRSSSVARPPGSGRRSRTTATSWKGGTASSARTSLRSDRPRHR